MPAPDARRPLAPAALAALLLMRFALVFLTHPAYGLHRDEFLYFAQGDHLSLTQSTFPPMIGAIAAASRSLLGDAPLAARVPASLAATALFGIVLLLIPRLGGGRVAQAFAALALVAAPVLVRPGVLFHPVVLDQLWCTAAMAALLLAAHAREPRWWLAIGAALGLGALTKFSAAFYAAGILGAALLVPVARRQLATRWPWLGAALALLLAVPTVLGQQHWGWPIVAQMVALRDMQLRHVTLAAFSAGQVFMMGAGITLALAGVAAALREGTPPARLAAAFAAIVLTLIAAMQGKEYYAAPVYPPLIAVGAVWLEGRTWFRALRHRVALAAVMAACALALLPMGVPLLAPGPMARYAAALGVTAATRTNTGTTLPLPQDYADMLGWPAQAAAVGRAWRTLPPDEQARAIVGASNYGQAGALAFWRARHGYPYPISTAGDFWLWGPGTRAGETALVLAPPDAAPALARVWRRVTPIDTLREPLGVPTEQLVILYRAEGLVRPLGRYWQETGPNWR